MSKVDAITWKWPGSQVSQHGDKIIWHDEAQRKTDAEIDAAVAAYMARTSILGQITCLEALETKRRVAEAMPDDAGGTASGRAWMAANRITIAALRATL
jgi:hypothetical protein